MAHSKTKIDHLIQQKHIFSAQCSLESYRSRFESIWITLADSTVAKRQALDTICSGGVVCNTHTVTSEFRTTQEAVVTVFGSHEVIDCIWHNQCGLKASDGDLLGLSSGSQSLEGTGKRVAKSDRL